MNVSRGDIVQVGNSCFLILGYSSFGYTVMNVSYNGEPWRNIPCLYIDDIGAYVCLTSIHYEKIDCFHSLLGYINDRQYSQIINTLSDYFKGFIGYFSDIENPSIMYVDDHEKLVENKIEIDEATSLEPVESVSETEDIQIEKVLPKRIKLMDILNEIREEPSKSVDNTRTIRSRRNDKNYNLESVYVTDDDILTIATSPISEIQKEYGVTFYSAKNIIFCVRKYLGLSQKKDVNRNSYMKHFDEGKSLDEVLAMYGKERQDVIKRSYSNWRSIINYPDNEKDVDWFPESDYNQILSNSIEWFSETYKLKYTSAYKIRNELLNEKIYRNPLACSGFGYIDIDMNAENIVRMYGKSRNIKADLEVVKDIKACYYYYLLTFEDHGKIINGKKEIPEEIPEEMRGILMNLIKNRFFYHSKFYPEMFTKEQIAAIEEGDRYKTSKSFTLSTYRCLSLSLNRKRMDH